MDSTNSNSFDRLWYCFSNSMSMEQLLEFALTSKVILSYEIDYLNSFHDRLMQGLWKRSTNGCFYNMDNRHEKLAYILLNENYEADLEKSLEKLRNMSFVPKVFDEMSEPVLSSDQNQNVALVDENIIVYENEEVEACENSADMAEILESPLECVLTFGAESASPILEQTIERDIQEYSNALISNFDIPQGRVFDFKDKRCEHCAHTRCKNKEPQMGKQGLYPEFGLTGEIHAVLEAQIACNWMGDAQLSNAPDMLDRMPEPKLEVTFESQIIFVFDPGVSFLYLDTNPYTRLTELKIAWDRDNKYKGLYTRGKSGIGLARREGPVHLAYIYDHREHFSKHQFLFWMAPLLISASTFGTCYLLNIPLTASSIFTFVATLRLVQDPVRAIPDVIAVVIQARVAFARIVKFLGAPELQTEKVRKKRNLDYVTHAISMKSATFSWEVSPSKPTLRNINLAVRVGEKVAICGEVGSGKSTLLASIYGEVPCIAGTVDVYGRSTYVTLALYGHSCLPCVVRLQPFNVLMVTLLVDVTPLLVFPLIYARFEKSVTKNSLMKHGSYPFVILIMKYDIEMSTMMLFRQLTLEDKGDFEGVRRDSERLRAIRELWRPEFDGISVMKSLTTSTDVLMFIRTYLLAIGNVSGLVVESIRWNIATCLELMQEQVKLLQGSKLNDCIVVTIWISNPRGKESLQVTVELLSGLYVTKVFDPGGLRLCSCFGTRVMSTGWTKCCYCCESLIPMAWLFGLFCYSKSIMVNFNLATKAIAHDYDNQWDVTFVFDPGGQYTRLVIVMVTNPRLGMCYVWLKYHLSLILEDKDHFKRPVLIHIKY